MSLHWLQGMPFWASWLWLCMVMSRVTKTPGKVNAFMEQESRKRVAAFVWECMEYRQFEAPDLLPYFTREEAD
jgi:hypothetical protein